MDYIPVLMTTAILWLILFLPVLALAISAAAYIELVRRQSAGIDARARRLSLEANEHRESEERYSLLLENASNAIMSLDGQG